MKGVDAAQPLEAGMVLSIETTMLHPRRGFIKLEDTVAVTEDRLRDVRRSRPRLEPGRLRRLGEGRKAGPMPTSPENIKRRQPQRADDQPPPGEQRKAVARDIVEQVAHHDHAP